MDHQMDQVDQIDDGMAEHQECTSRTNKDGTSCRPEEDNWVSHVRFTNTFGDTVSLFANLLKSRSLRNLVPVINYRPSKSLTKVMNGFENKFPRLLAAERLNNPTNMTDAPCPRPSLPGVTCESITGKQAVGSAAPLSKQAPACAPPLGELGVNADLDLKSSTTDEKCLQPSTSASHDLLSTTNVSLDLTYSIPVDLCRQLSITADLTAVPTSYNSTEPDLRCDSGRTLPDLGCDSEGTQQDLGCDLSPDKEVFSPPGVIETAATEVPDGEAIQQATAQPLSPASVSGQAEGKTLNEGGGPRPACQSASQLVDDSQPQLDTSHNSHQQRVQASVNDKQANGETESMEPLSNSGVGLQQGGLISSVGHLRLPPHVIRDSIPRQANVEVFGERMFNEERMGPRLTPEGLTQSSPERLQEINQAIAAMKNAYKSFSASHGRFGGPSPSMVQQSTTASTWDPRLRLGSCTIRKGSLLLVLDIFTTEAGREGCLNFVDAPSSNSDLSECPLTPGMLHMAELEDGAECLIQASAWVGGQAPCIVPGAGDPLALDAPRLVLMHPMKTAAGNTGESSASVFQTAGLHSHASDVHSARNTSGNYASVFQMVDLSSLPYMPPITWRNTLRVRCQDQALPISVTGPDGPFSTTQGGGNATQVNTTQGRSNTTQVNMVQADAKAGLLDQVTIDMGEVFDAASPHLMWVEVWDGYKIISSIPVMSFPEEMSATAQELGCVPEGLVLQGTAAAPSLPTANELSGLGMWQELVESLRASPPNNSLANGMAKSPAAVSALGLQLLDRAVRAGWVHVAAALFDDLLGLCDVSMKAVLSSPYLCHPLLHSAVLSTSINMVELVRQRTDQHGCSISWDLPDALGFSPMHLATQMEELNLLWELLSRYPDADAALHVAVQGQVTPAEMLAARRFCMSQEAEDILSSSLNHCVADALADEQSVSKGDEPGISKVDEQGVSKGVEPGISKVDEQVVSKGVHCASKGVEVAGPIAPRIPVMAGAPPSRTPAPPRIPDPSAPRIPVNAGPHLLGTPAPPQDHGTSRPPDPVMAEPPSGAPLPPDPVMAEAPLLGTQLPPGSRNGSEPPLLGAPATPPSHCNGGAPPSRDPAPPRIRVIGGPPLLGPAPPRIPGPSAPQDHCNGGAPPSRDPAPPRITGPSAAQDHFNGGAPPSGTQRAPQDHCLSEAPPLGPAPPRTPGPSAPQDHCNGGAPPSRDPAPPRIPVMAEPPLQAPAPPGSLWMRSPPSRDPRPQDPWTPSAPRITVMTEPPLLDPRPKDPVMVAPPSRDPYPRPPRIPVMAEPPLLRAQRTPDLCLC
eukprot:gene1490-32875_t